MSAIVHEVDYKRFEVNMGFITDWKLNATTEGAVTVQDFLKLECDDARFLAEVAHILRHYGGQLYVSKKVHKKLCLVAVFNVKNIAVAFAKEYVELVYLTYK